MSIRIIKSSPGNTTTEEILQLLFASPQGITAREICRALNRPVSMVQICLKALKSSRQVYAKTDNNARTIKYYSRFSSNLEQNHSNHP